MLRGARDTASWFDNDNKATIVDKEIASGIGPGKYEVA